MPLQSHLFGQLDLSSLIGKGIFVHGFFLFSAVLWVHTTSLTLYLTCSVAIFTPPLGLLELVDDITAFIPTIHHPLKRKQEMNTLYSPQWWLCLMLNLHYSYWNKSLSSAIHHQSQRSFIRTWKTPLKKRKKQVQLTSAAINHRFPV